MRGSNFTLLHPRVFDLAVVASISNFIDSVCAFLQCIAKLTLWAQITEKGAAFLNAEPPNGSAPNLATFG